ncbi:MAG: DUF1385 domain-containing protein [Clostridia bacterium]|nr:DUF1385 domain-containing protein [Clostridia bacterium]
MRSKEKCLRITSIGGQALIEGIMMRGPKKTCIAVRNPGGEIVFEEVDLHPIKEKYPVLGFPFIRGTVAFIESLKIGYGALSRSIELSGMEEEDEPSKFERWLTKKFGEKVDSFIMGLAGVLGVALAVFLFIFLPILLFNLLLKVCGEGLAPWRSLCEGVMRILIFILYVAAVSLIPDIKRVFQYHGAEHKTIFCYEAAEEMTVENVRKHSRFHPRCGTSFMVLILLIGIFVGIFIPFENPFLRSLAKIICIPIVMGVGYELIKICGRYQNILTAIVSAPGKWVQRLTTKEPDDKMIEVAIAAMSKVIPEDGADLL